KKNNNIKINKNINSNNIKKIYSNKFVKLVSSIVLVYISINLLFYQNKYNNTISFLNIGQGDSIVIQNKETTYTIDGGSSSNKQNGKYILSPFFLSKRINTIDISFLTHADSDHTNGIIYLINEEDKIKINNIALPIYAKDNEKYKKIIDSANSKNINILYVSSNKNNYFENENYDTSLIFNKNITNDNFTKSKLNIIYPLDDDLSKKDLNYQSIVIKLNIESIEKDFSFLFTGDISKKVEKILLEKKENQISNINILKVAHHGSKTSSSEEFIEKVAPLYAIISFGNNNYGHPNEEVLKILNENNCEIIKTKEAGEIDFHIQNNEIIINKFIKK
ncbi:MAG: MBL fold metallo-hydrolase, partial [Eubacteriales bacterium]|nr:MBL fold metallo-hydrolase [Eubacteriales bacterium]